MTVDADFETKFSLRLKIRAQAKRIAELESGGAYAKLRAKMSSMRRDHDAEVRALRRELAAQGRLNAKMRRCWFEVFEQVERERDEAVERAVRGTRLARESRLRVVWVSPQAERISAIVNTAAASMNSLIAILYTPSLLIISIIPSIMVLSAVY